MSRRRDPLDVVEASPKISAPTAFWSVGLVAALGFAVGIALPQLTEMRLAPRPPSVEGAQRGKPRSAGSKSARPRDPAKPKMTGRVEAVIAETTVHEAPGSTKVVGHLPKGTKVLIEADHGPWLHVRHGPDARGFIVRTAIAGTGS